MARRSPQTEESRIVNKYFQKEKDSIIRPTPITSESATAADLELRYLQQLADASRAYEEHRATPEQILYLRKHGRID